jgi:hypothetical protein
VERGLAGGSQESSSSSAVVDALIYDLIVGDKSDDLHSTKGRSTES